jgi:hypothetical protein
MQEQTATLLGLWWLSSRSAFHYRSIGIETCRWITWNVRIVFGLNFEFQWTTDFMDCLILKTKVLRSFESRQLFISRHGVTCEKTLTCNQFLPKLINHYTNVKNRTIRTQTTITSTKPSDENIKCPTCTPTHSHSHTAQFVALAPRPQAFYSSHWELTTTILSLLLPDHTLQSADAHWLPTRGLPSHAGADYYTKWWSMIWMEDETSCSGVYVWGGNKEIVRDSATRYCCSAASLASRGISSPMGRNEENNANQDAAFEQELSDAKW